MSKEHWGYLLLGMLLAWLFLPRRVEASITTGEAVVRYL